MASNRKIDGATARAKLRIKIRRKVVAVAKRKRERGRRTFAVGEPDIPERQGKCHPSPPGGRVSNKHKADDWVGCFVLPEHLASERANQGAIVVPEGIVIRHGWTDVEEGGIEGIDIRYLQKGFARTDITEPPRWGSDVDPPAVRKGGGGRKYGTDPVLPDIGPGVIPKADGPCNPPSAPPEPEPDRVPYSFGPCRWCKREGGASPNHRCM